jgi:multidrug efflux pump subunit AcrA (membrane-fusion protein)
VLKIEFIKKIIIITSLVMLTSCAKKTIETSPIRKNITDTVFASGILVPDNKYNLTSLSDGYIIKLNFDEGDIVKKGELLALVENEQNDINVKGTEKLLSIALSNTKPESPALKQIKVNIEMAKQKLKQDEIQVERFKNLYELESIPKIEYENILLALENSKTNLKALEENYEIIKQQAEQQVVIQKTQSDLNKYFKKNNEVRALVSGKIYNKKKEIGDLTKKGDIIATIGSPNNLYALFNVDETNISKIKLNQNVIIQLNTDKNKTYKAKVTKIYPSFDEQTQSFFCRVDFIDKPDFNISGTQLQGNFIISHRQNVLVIPRKFLSYGNKVNIKDKGEIKVETGFISSEWVEIKKGLNEKSVILIENIK